MTEFYDIIKNKLLNSIVNFNFFLFNMQKHVTILKAISSHQTH